MCLAQGAVRLGAHRFLTWAGAERGTTLPRGLCGRAYGDARKLTLEGRELTGAKMAAVGEERSLFSMG